MGSCNNVIDFILDMKISVPKSACVAWRFCRAGRTSGEAVRKIKTKLLPPQSPRGFSALARLYYLARPTKTAMLPRLYQNSQYNDKWNKVK